MRTFPATVVNGLNLKQWLAANTIGFRCDLLTTTTADGTKYRWTNTDVDVPSGGNLYRSAGPYGPVVKRRPYRQSARLTVDTLELSLVGGGFQINGKNLPVLGVQRYFDGARVQIDHLIGPHLPGALLFGPILSFFEGRVAEVTPQGAALNLILKSELESININLPKFLIQPQCGYAVYDANCGLSRAAFTLTGAASGSPTRSSVPTATAALTAKAAGYFNLGGLKFLNGLNANVERAIKSWDGTTFKTYLPFPFLPAAGDSISVYPGCDRSELQCGAAKFNNLPQFRGYPHTPSPESGS